MSPPFFYYQEEVEVIRHGYILQQNLFVGSKVKIWLNAVNNVECWGEVKMWCCLMNKLEGNL